MLKKSSPVITALLCYFNLLMGNTFIVTSNADSGPETLREAIAFSNANGMAVFDTILFNIPDISTPGRTITLQSSLSISTSKIVIDGTSQPGVKFGVSDAKIKIQHSGSISFSQGLILFNVDFIEFYGLCFFDFRFGDPNPMEIRCALYTIGLIRNLTIGSPGKGNVFYDNVIAIANRYFWGSNPGDKIVDLVMQSNFFGLHHDGISFQSTGWAFFIRSLKNITIGGSNVSEGNYFASNYSGTIAHLQYDSINNNGFALVSNNSFGSDFTKTTGVKCGTLEISGVNNINADVSVTITKNSFNNPSLFFINNCHPMLSLHNIIGYLTIIGNKIGNLTNPLACQTTGIGIWECENGIIGGIDPDDQNIIAANYINGISINNNRNITIQRNSIFCNALGIKASSNKVAIPEVKILNENGVNAVSGSATPNCKIEVFQTPRCNGCENGEIFMGETVSDASGNWSFNGNFSSAVTATATTANGVTGEFATPKFLQAINTKYPTCSLNNGHIIGTQFISGTKYYWVRITSTTVDTVFNQLDLTNIGPGVYTFVVEQTAYCKKSYTINLYDQSPILNDQNPSLINPTCGLSNGKILNIFAAGSYNKVYWLNINRDTVSRSLDLLNVGAEGYKLIIMDTIYGCGDSTATFTLINQSGPALNFNNTQIVNATCTNANGSITGLSTTNVTGTPFIQWLDSLNNPIGSSLNLTNVPAGKYKLKFKDQSGCDTIITPFYNISASGRILIDTTGKNLSAAGCTTNKGSIRNINVTGADSYSWQNLTTNNPAGSTIDIFNLAPGNYQLTATNATGCNALSPVITIQQAVFAPIGVNGTQARNAFCGEDNGIIRILSFNKDSNLYSFRWIDSSSNQQIGTGTSIDSIGAGSYLLIATDTNGCQKQIYKSTIGAYPKPIINLTGIKITDDKCSASQGAINGITVSGAFGPTTYIWRDANNNVIGSTINLQNVSQGQYNLTVVDAGVCTIQSGPVTVGNTNSPGIVLQYDDQVIPRNTSTTLIIKNFQPGNYFLYSDAAGTQLIQQNNTGTFNTNALVSDAVYYIKYVSGTCTSSLKPVKVSVVDKSFFVIASAFTPNNDGLNDKLRLKIIGLINVDYFRIFNRNGEEVFFTKIVDEGWDGKIKGILQPTGVYVWIASGKDISGKPITDKGSFVLMR